MSLSLNGFEILDAAEDDLRQVVQLLAAAKPAELEQARHLLEKQISLMSMMGPAARQNQSSSVKDALLRIRGLLTKAQLLTKSALEILSRRISLAGLNAAEPESTVRFEG